MEKVQISQEQFTKQGWEMLLDYSHRIEVWMGSAGSGKSYSIAQKIVVRALKEPIKILVCRRFGTTLKNSVFSLIKEILRKWKIRSYLKVNESDYSMTFPNGSQIICMGLDNEEKLLSINDISCIWVEEAYEISQSMFEQLNLRMRGSASNQQIILSFNPINRNHWLYTLCEEKQPTSFVYLHSTYRDNPFLSNEYIQALKELEERNPQRARIFCDGQWGVDTEGLVFTNWKTQDFNPMELANLEHRVGSDLGYIDPTTIACSLWDKENKTIYVYDEFYKRGCQLDEVLQAMKDKNLTKSLIYMDSAEPRTIDFFRRQGINARPCIKGAGSIDSRIRFLQNQTIIVRPSCEHMISELENFSYIKDKINGDYTDKMTHEYSHLIDGLSYAYSDIYSKSKLLTISKQTLGVM